MAPRSPCAAAVGGREGGAAATVEATAAEPAYQAVGTRANGPVHRLHRPLPGVQGRGDRSMGFMRTVAHSGERASTTLPSGQESQDK
eukprot:258093-Prymnesium_polylepis.1